MRVIFIALLVLIFFACKEEAAKENVDCKVDANLVSEFLQKNKSNVIETTYLADYEKDGCVNVDSFIRTQLMIKRKEDDIRKVFEDTLYAFLGLTNFEEIANNKIEIIGLTKSRFAFGMNDMFVVTANKTTEGPYIKSYHVKFNHRCSPVIARKELTQDCFEMVSENKKIVSEKKWKQLKMLIQETDLVSTVYFDNSAVRMCDGDAYSIRYSSGHIYDNTIKEFFRSCPGEKTAIYLVSEKLLEIANDN